MPIPYNIEDDVRFQQGKEQEREQAVKNLLLANVAPKQVAEYWKVSLELVQKVAKSIKK